MSIANQHNPKEQMIAVLKEQPDDSTFDELLRELACLRATKRGLRDVDEGNTVSNGEALRRIKSWHN